MITKKQLELFNYIHREVTNSGVAPSFDEMKEALNLKSKSGIHRLISGPVSYTHLRAHET